MVRRIDYLIMQKYYQPKNLTMFKNLFMVLILAIGLVACGTSTQKQENKNQEEVVLEANPVTVIVEDFDSVAGDLVGQEIEMTGTIVHVCQHGGKRMFIINEDPDMRVKITTNEDMAAFNTDLEGSDVVVRGIVEELRIDEDYLQNWESELQAEAGGDSEHKIHTGEEGHEHHEGDANHELEQINNLRQEIADSGTDHLSYYSVVCTEYKQK